MRLSVDWVRGSSIIGSVENRLVDLLAAQIAMTTGKQRFNADADWWAKQMMNALGKQLHSSSNHLKNSIIFLSELT